MRLLFKLKHLLVPMFSLVVCVCAPPALGQGCPIVNQTQFSNGVTTTFCDNLTPSVFVVFFRAGTQVSAEERTTVSAAAEAIKQMRPDHPIVVVGHSGRGFPEYCS